MNVIQFRNSFDSQGPGVSGVRPAEAVARLHDFQQHYTQFEAKRKTLDSVQLLFGIIPTPFPELDKTGEVGCFHTVVCLTSVYMKDHVFELQRKILRHDSSSQLYTQLMQL